jgi:hypothetical protein
MRLDGARRGTHPELGSEVICIRLVHLLPTRHDVVKLLIVRLMDRLFQTIIAFVLVGFESCKILRDLFVSVRQPCPTDAGQDLTTRLQRSCSR